ncbi:MAG: AAA family ATPase [bacterium]
MLKSIELAGFKSFGKKAVLEFNCPISSIVGPNGSGKSNVAEAFRFVLGEQSIKSMRGKKVEDLIFNGGKDAPRANRASAKVVFDNSRRILNIDFDEVAIERVVHRDAVSEYFINGSPVRLRDIIELLASAHIGASGHHIISQGEADKILNSNIRERREMIEDALGLKIYQYKKEESRRKLDKTEENIKQVESLRREIAPHIKFLKKQVEKIEKTAEMREELKKLYLEYFKREKDYLDVEKSRLENEKRGPLAELHRLETELKQAKEILAKSDTKDQKSDEIMALESSLREVRSSKDSLMREIGRIEGEVSSLERLLQKQRDLARTAETKTVELSGVENVARAIDVEINEAAASQDISKIKTVLGKIRELLKSFIDKNKTEENLTAQKEIEEEVRVLREKKHGIEAGLSEIKIKENDLVSQYNKVKNEIEKEKDSNRDAEKAVFRIMAEQNEITGHLAVLRGREERLVTNEANFKQELTEAGVLVGLGAVRYQEMVIFGEGDVSLTPEQVAGEERVKQEERRRIIERIKIRIEDSGIGGGDEVMKEFREVSERDTFLAKELEDLVKSSESLNLLIKELDEKLATEFKAGVEKINVQFQEFFSKMFGGGTAKLALIREKKRKKSDTEMPMADDGEMVQEEEEEGEEGIDIEVNLPKKKVKGLMMLSGGERTLTSIALIFAMSQVNPPPFIILDETDAALDEANSKRYGDMIENLSKYSQLILVTHNRETMSRAGIIYGVTMGSDGVSKLLSIQFEEAVQVAK